MKNPDLNTFVLSSLKRPAIAVCLSIAAAVVLSPVIVLRNKTTPVGISLIALLSAPLYLISHTIVNEVASSVLIRIRQTRWQWFLYQNTLSLSLALPLSAVLVLGFMIKFRINQMVVPGQDLAAIFFFYLLLQFLLGIVQNMFCELLNARRLALAISILLLDIEFLTVVVWPDYQFRYVYHAVYDLVYRSNITAYLSFLVLSELLTIAGTFIGHEVLEK